MCISLYPAHLTNTLIMGNVVEREGQTVHVVAYQNRVTNTSGKKNLMVLLVPAAAQLGPDNFIATSQAPNVLEDIVTATTVVSRGFTLGGGSEPTRGGMVVFRHDVFTIGAGYCRSREDLEEALAQFPEDVRPDLNWSVLEDLPETHPGFQLVLAAFDVRDAAKALLAYWYVPTDPTTLFLPAFDAHDGRKPQPGAFVDVDHTIFVGSADGTYVRYSDELGELAPFVPDQVLRVDVYGGLPNGDFTHKVGSRAVHRTNCGKVFALSRYSHG